MWRPGPQPRSCEFSVACRTSSIVSENLSERMTEGVSERMSEDMSEEMDSSPRSVQLTSLGVPPEGEKFPVIALDYKHRRSASALFV